MAWLPGGLAELRWGALVALFVAALATLAVYLVQYALLALRRGRPAPAAAAPAVQRDELLEEGGSVLAWALSRGSWRRQWRRAWVAALRAEAAERVDSQLLTFEEDDPAEPLELAVKEVNSVVKSAGEKVVSCNVVGDSVKFLVAVSAPPPAAAEPQSYFVKLSPVHLQLQLYVKDKGEDVKVEWFLINTDDINFEIQPAVQEEQTAGTCAISETLRDVLKNLFSSASPSVVLSVRPADTKEVQNVQNTSLLPQGTSPPKPPRAHELRLLVRNIEVKLSDLRAAGSTDLVCIVQLNDPMQKFSSSVAKNAAHPFWTEEFIFELSAKSKALQLQVVEDGKLDSPLSGKVTVPLDLFRKQPSGQHSFALSRARESSSEPELGSISAEFSFIEPSELKARQVSSPVLATKIEKDRTVMPCGTVVTTVTAVRTKPRLEGRASPLSTDSPVKTPVKVKVTEKDFTVEALHSHGAPVSKTLSSSDTELLVLNGTDPVAEAAIRQLSESAKQKLKSPRKKSTIIISGVSKTSLSQDSEASLMMDYAAAMDSSCREADPPTVEEAGAKITSDKKQPLSASERVPDTDPQQSTHKAWGLENGSQQWDTSTLLDQTSEEISGSSLSVSETGSMKKSKGGILKKSAKLFFRRQHHQKDPGMSQSHNDLVFLQQPLSEESRKKGGTLSRILSKKLLSRNKSKNKLNGASGEPYL
ncbi:C2 domain-containing protein 2 [Catharus ustulatus]|uniref:C2 domain-containing protein 2 n=1 Tax=Catharus ustulatus TaxID=91951 RepID=UPI00140E63DB|nr:C2 domain-containing protein 2 [Catharus ustulatus]